jgi:signal transduction histidine kinase
VEDNGIGIPEQDIEHIFDRFYRVDQSRARSAGGSGLGLAIVKAILDLHRAEIDVQSTLGKGTKFTVRMHKVAY